ncbi:MAG: TetR/AcrR family transcriptional regulator [Lachnospiraceae bacterium]|uniref:TetR/AcrR family transcriptional regulator n=1 Tax=Roseburia hominis TaxID=301301 RepID=UPI001F2654F9|nr:TetR/AcrR family transcriptional regulator [Roseburia hominis]MCI5713092.1 TetR/AcrR family transcriptional regulator [Lachnospiraceae bacterium]MDD6168546.1 TetR/AcrR family transcriptional regulator [Lachnospiraceae bacterium]MDY4840530.1 TetR/AcrR family transcriptional regulator [Lachnospiraceae bacterium]
MPKSSERCREIREEMKEKIIKESMLYFAKNGFSGTKISDLAKYIGIGQGTIYVYFKSKEDLFSEIYRRINNSSDIKELKRLSHLPISARQKIHKLTQSIMENLKADKNYAAKVTLNTQMMLGEEDYASADTTYQSKLYQYTAQIIKQGQKEGSVVAGDAMKLSDYYWGVVYLYALKQLFTTSYEMISVKDLERILLKDEKNE